MFKNLSKNIAIPFALVVLMVLGGIGVFAFRYFKSGVESPPSSQATTSETGIVPSEQVATSVSPEAAPENIPDFSKEIGQMLIIGFRGTQAPDGSYIAKVIKDLKIGGVVLFDYDVPSKSFPRNIENPERVKKLIADLQKYSKTPLFVSVDAEGGKINRLKEEYGFIKVPSAKEMGQGDYGETEKTAQELGKQLKDLGFNMDFAPVVDLAINPENPIIGKLGRAFSADPLEVTGHAKGFIEGLRREGIIAVVKHFPGHGSAKEDSHLSLVDVTETYQEVELFPYHLLQGEGVMDAVMTAHIKNRNVDQNEPATLSSLFIEDILRRQIGFEGVVISDDMQMAAITQEYGYQEAVVRAINAGCDIILLSNNSTTPYDENLPYKVRDIISQAVKDGRISQYRILEAFLRIEALKKQFGILTFPP